MRGGHFCYWLWEPKTQATPLCVQERGGELIKLSPPPHLHVLTHLEDKLEHFCVTFVFNSTIAFPVMQVVKTNHKPCFEPLFSLMFIFNTFLRHRL
jgi:hypothetical protein